MAPRHTDEAHRTDLLDRAVDFVCSHGLSDLSLRPLAKALGTSPRTLLYYFGSKDDLVVEIIRRARGRQQTMMGNLKMTADMPAGSVFRLLWRHWSQPSRVPLMSLFFEIYAMAIADSSRFPGFLENAIEEWLVALEPCSTLPGFDRERARALATIFIATFRGFMLDLAATDDRPRIDAAVAMWISFFESAPQLLQGAGDATA
jgi:AcrR family transcriptional regulator